MKRFPCLLFLLSFLTLCSVISHADQPPSSAETDPHVVVEKALHAYQMKDLEGYQKLLARPLPFGTSQAKAFSHAKEIFMIEKPKGYYQLAQHTVAAVLSSVPDDPRSIWFEIIQTKRGSYAVKGLIVSGKNPPMNIELE